MCDLWIFDQLENSLQLCFFVMSGNFSIGRILQWLTTARLIAFHEPNPLSGKTFLEYDHITSDIYTFIASTKATVSQNLYSLLHEPLPNGGKLPSLAVRIHLGYVGTSSLNTVATLINHETGDQLAYNVNQVVTFALCSICKCFGGINILTLKTDTCLMQEHLLSNSRTSNRFLNKCRETKIVMRAAKCKSNSHAVSGTNSSNGTDCNLVTVNSGEPHW